MPYRRRRMASSSYRKPYRRRKTYRRSYRKAPRKKGALRTSINAPTSIGSNPWLSTANSPLRSRMRVKMRGVSPFVGINAIAGPLPSTKQFSLSDLDSVRSGHVYTNGTPKAVNNYETFARFYRKYIVIGATVNCSFNCATGGAATGVICGVGAYLTRPLTSEDPLTTSDFLSLSNCKWAMMNTLNGAHSTRTTLAPNFKQMSGSPLKLTDDAWVRSISNTPVSLDREIACRCWVASQNPNNNPDSVYLTVTIEYDVIWFDPIFHTPTQSPEFLIPSSAREAIGPLVELVNGEPPDGFRTDSLRPEKKS